MALIPTDSDWLPFVVNIPFTEALNSARATDSSPQKSHNSNDNAKESNSERATKSKKAKSSSKGGEKIKAPPKWVPDELVTECKQCGATFNAFLLCFKHHCRACGDIFCGSCTKFCTLPQFGINENVRVCGPCFDKEMKRREKEEQKKLKKMQSKLDEERLQALFVELHTAYENSDEEAAIAIKAQIDELREAIYKREQLKQQRALEKKEKGKGKEKKSKPKSEPSTPSTVHKTSSSESVKGKEKQKQSSAKPSYAVRAVSGEPDTPETIRMKLQEKLQLPLPKILNPPSGNKCCLVLDIDYTLFDHRWYTQVKDEFKKEKSLMPEFQRPYLHQFLKTVSERFDLIIWSATGMAAIDSKMTNLGIYSSPDYKITMVLSKDYMISIKRRSEKGNVVEETVKPLEVIWSKFPEYYSPKNTVHIDDMVNNFRLNPNNGILITPYKEAPKNKEDTELMYLTKYLLLISKTESDFSQLNHRKWKEYIISKLWEKQTEFTIPEHVPQPPKTEVLAESIAAQVEASLRSKAASPLPLLPITVKEPTPTTDSPSNSTAEVKDEQALSSTEPDSVSERSSNISEETSVVTTTEASNQENESSKLQETNSAVESSTSETVNTEQQSSDNQTS